MYYADLTRCDYLGSWQDRLLAVGWLEGDHPYSRGSVPAEFLNRLQEFARRPWADGTFAGSHKCSLNTGCSATGVANILVPDGRFILVAPEMIVHYVTAHEYRPPLEFQAAVLRCPPMGSVAYLEALDLAGVDPTEGAALYRSIYTPDPVPGTVSEVQERVEEQIVAIPSPELQTLVRAHLITPELHWRAWDWGEADFPCWVIARWPEPDADLVYCAYGHDCDWSVMDGSPRRFGMDSRWQGTLAGAIARFLWKDPFPEFHDWARQQSAWRRGVLVPPDSPR